jgi:hypothetical protein
MYAVMALMKLQRVPSPKATTKSYCNRIPPRLGSLHIPRTPGLYPTLLHNWDSMKVRAMVPESMADAPRLHLGLFLDSMA